MPIKHHLHPSIIVKEIIKDGGIKLHKDHNAGLIIYRFVYARSRLTENVAKKLVEIFPNTDVYFWLNLQRDYDASQLEEGG